MVRIDNANFIRSAAKKSDFPTDGRPQIVMAGRSNVGKSSMINCLLNRKNIARVSAAPGKTANINLFMIDEKFYLVDLPGYGYSKVSHAERERWGELMSSYFEFSRDIALGILIVDIRHKPTDGDISMADLYEHYGIPYVIVANKADKLNKTETAQAIKLITETFNLDDESHLIVFSTLKKTGRDELLKVVIDAVTNR